MTPPTWIDWAWHLQMSFEEDYAALLAAIGRDIPHRQGLTPAERHAAWDRGRALWRAEFGEEPPKKVWPERHKSWREVTGWFFLGLCAVTLAPWMFLDELWVPAGFPWNAKGTWLEIATLSFILGAVLLYQPEPKRISRCG